jgi:hypothetical protein
VSVHVTTHKLASRLTTTANQYDYVDYSMDVAHNHAALTEYQQHSAVGLEYTDQQFTPSELYAPPCDALEMIEAEQMPTWVPDASTIPSVSWRC